MNQHIVDMIDAPGFMPKGFFKLGKPYPEYLIKYEADQ